MAYSDKVIDHYENPRNVGVLDKDSSRVGTGMVGAPACGDVMRLQIQVNDNGVIEDAKFKTYGCGSAIASSSLLTEWVKGKTLDEARRDQEFADRRRTGPAAGQGALLGAGRRCDQGRDRRPAVETGREPGSSVIVSLSGLILFRIHCACRGGQAQYGACPVFLVRLAVRFPRHVRSTMRCTIGSPNPVPRFLDV